MNKDQKKWGPINFIIFNIKSNLPMYKSLQTCKEKNRNTFHLVQHSFR